MIKKYTYTEYQLYKLDKSEIIYITPSNQCWGLCKEKETYKKICISKKISCLSDFKEKKMISYQNSLLIKKGTHLNILKNYILILSRKKKIIINFLKTKKTKHTTLNFSNLSLNLNNLLTRKMKKDYGIFFTSEILIDKILNKLKIILARLTNINIKNILEPSCGSGEFLIKLDVFFSKSNIVAFEYNNIIFDKIKDFSLLNNYLTIENKNFLNCFSDEQFDLIIGNPPFKLINKSLITQYKNFFPTKVNIYALFLLHSLNKLRKNGILVFVLPKSFFNSIPYIKIRLYIKNNYKILFIMNNCKKTFKNTSIETCVLFLQKKKSTSKKYFVFFGQYISFNTHYKYLNNILIKSKSLKELGFNITVGNIVKSQLSKDCSTNLEKGYFICDKNIINNKLNLDYSSSIIYSNNLQYNICVVIFRGYGNVKYNFKYALVDIQKGYLIENHLLIIRHSNTDLLIKLIDKFNNNFFLDFISLYFSNQSLNKKELELIPIFL